MKVKELIELLQKEDPEAEVFYSHFEDCSDSNGMGTGNDVDLEIDYLTSSKDIVRLK